MKSGVGPQKLRKYRRQTPIWASICTPVAPSQLKAVNYPANSSGSSRQNHSRPNGLENCGRPNSLEIVYF